jgi:DNA-binding beta-propeller fold protein YncE
MKKLTPYLFLSALVGCSGLEVGTDVGLAGDAGAPVDGATPDAVAPDAASSSASLPLVLVADVPLPGASNRFDYQEIDSARGQLVIAHMNDATVLIVDLTDGSVRQALSGIPTPRGVAVASELGRIFVTSTPGHLVLIDAVTLIETSRVVTGAGPDGVGWDPIDQIVGVSDQGDGALSLIAEAGTGARVQIPLGIETGNVAFDASRGLFWITVVAASGPDLLVGVDPSAATVTTTIELSGCEGAHGLRIHPDGHSALIACEANDMLARVDLDGAHAVSIAPTGAGPDVLSIDPGLGWIYVSAESGDLTVFDLAQPGLVLVGHDHPGTASHTVQVDPATHRVFFPLPAGPDGTPVLRIMRPTGT